MKPALMHGMDWAGQSIAGWWLSEKLDGWRVLWTGSEFITRHGTQLDAPNWFTAGMPAQPLDGELWAGKGTTHDDVAAAVRSGDWDGLTFRPFDIPTPGITPEAAMGILASLPLPPHVRPVEYRRTTSTGDAIAMMRATVAAGGEGVMVREPDFSYTGTRTERLLKLKPAGVEKILRMNPESF